MVLYVPLITPITNGAVDYETYARLVERQIAQGSHGIVVAGTTGEPTTLSVEERTTLLKVAIDTAGKRIPVVAATGSQSHADTVELTMSAERAGAAAVLILTPYFIRPPQRGIVEYYADLAQRISLPMMIYHIPGRASISVTCDTVGKNRRAGTEPGRHQAGSQGSRTGERAAGAARPRVPDFRRTRGPRASR